MRTRLVSLTVSVALSLVIAISPASGVTVLYEGMDPGVGPGGPRPNSDAAAALFDAAVGASGLIDFENLAVDSSNFAGKLVAPGVTATMTNSKAGDPYNGISDLNTVIEGYNTTAGGSLHLGLAPASRATAIATTFDFTDSVDFFGAYITGLGTASGNFHILFDDGAAQDIPVAGHASGGVQFFGFTDDAGSQISQVTLRISDAGGVGDFIGVDDVRYGAIIPEPATLSLLALGSLVALRRRRRNQATRQSDA